MLLLRYLHPCQQHHFTGTPKLAKPAWWRIGTAKDEKVAVERGSVTNVLFRGWKSVPAMLRKTSRQSQAIALRRQITSRQDRLLSYQRRRHTVQNRRLAPDPLQPRKPRRRRALACLGQTSYGDAASWGNSPRAAEGLGRMRPHEQLPALF